jgi:hypothetical protein
MLLFFNFFKEKEKKVNKLIIIIFIVFLSISVLSPYIISDMKYDKEMMLYYDVYGDLYFIYSIVYLLFTPLFIFF